MMWKAIAARCVEKANSSEVQRKAIAASHLRQNYQN
jgi:hypothetical protein